MKTHDDFASLQAEQEAFDKALDALMEEHAGQFVVFKDRKVVGFFPTYLDAYRAGVERFGADAVFLLSEVRVKAPETPSVSWCSGAMFVEP
jgi:hypothetical protein